MALCDVEEIGLFHKQNIAKKDHATEVSNVLSSLRLSSSEAGTAR